LGGVIVRAPRGLVGGDDPAGLPQRRHEEVDRDDAAGRPLDGHPVADLVGALDHDVGPADQGEQRLLERERHREADDAQGYQHAHPLLGGHAEQADDRRRAEHQLEQAAQVVPAAPARGTRRQEGVGERVTAVGSRDDREATEAPDQRRRQRHVAHERSGRQPELRDEAGGRAGERSQCERRVAEAAMMPDPWPPVAYRYRSRPHLDGFIRAVTDHSPVMSRRRVIAFA